MSAFVKVKNLYDEVIYIRLDAVTAVEDKPGILSPVTGEEVDSCTVSFIGGVSMYLAESAENFIKRAYR